MSKATFEVVEVDLKAQETEKARNDYRWYLQAKDDIAKSVFPLVDLIQRNQFRFWKRNLIFAQLYENIDSLLSAAASPLFGEHFDLVPQGQIFNSRLTYNVVKSCVDAATAKIAKNKPRVKFLTSGGDYSLTQKAKNLTKYMDGVFYSSDIYKVAPQVFKDACIFGTGCMKVYYDEYSKSVKIDRVLVPTELTIDWNDARYGKPSQIHQTKIVDKQVLMDLYPDVPELEFVETVPDIYNSNLEQVKVIESWKLSQFGGKGRHSICVNNITLVEEEYKKDYFPFLFFKWSDRVQGLFGYGLTEELCPIQLTISLVHKMIKAGQLSNTVPRAFVEAGSLLNKQSLYEGGVVEMRAGSQQPIFNTMPAMPGDIYQYLENLFNKAYAISGISQLQAASEKPAGVNSGVAMREFQDINTERFAIQGQQYEQLFLDAAKIIIDLSKQHNIKGVTVKSDRKKEVFTMDWSEADLQDNPYDLQCFPVSKLPTTPEGRLAFVTELAQAGYIDQTQALELLDVPDLENFFNLTNATFDAVLKDLETICEEPNELVMPDPAMNLKIAIPLAQAYYLSNKNRGLPEDTLQALRDYVQNCKDLPALEQAKAAQEQPQAPVLDPGAQMPGGQPMAQAAPPPVSQLLPMQA